MERAKQVTMGELNASIGVRELPPLLHSVSTFNRINSYRLNSPFSKSIEIYIIIIQQENKKPSKLLMPFYKSIKLIG